MDPFATIEELTDRLDWELDEHELRMAERSLEDASDLARAFGRSTWQDAQSAPRLVRTTVLTACVRYMRNPGGYTQSRAGDETLGWSDLGEQAGGVFFTDQEKKLLSGLAGKSAAFMSVDTFAYSSSRKRGVVWVPVNTSHSAVPERGFPKYAEGDPGGPLDGGLTGEPSA